RELLVVDRQDERRRAALLLGELGEVAVARDAQDLHPLLLDRGGERADAESRRVLGAEVFVDDDDGKAEFHRYLGFRPCGEQREAANYAAVWLRWLSRKDAKSRQKFSARRRPAQPFARASAAALPRSPRPIGVRRCRPIGRFFSAAMTAASASIQP